MPLLGYGKDVVKKIKSLKYITEVFPQGEVKTQIQTSYNGALTFLVAHTTLERNRISIIF